MSKLHASLLSGLTLVLMSGCEKTAAPPPEAATAPTETSAPAAAATPVATSEPSASEADKEPPPVAAPPEPTTSAVASATLPPSAAPPKETSPKAAAATPKAAAASTEKAPASAGPTPEDACQTKNFHYSQVASACKSGGRKAAKNVMKGAVAKAKAAGTDLKCTSCHQDMKDFHLKPNAVGDLKNWLP
jgi:hypothetical protein